MLCVLSFCQKDQDQAERLASWILDLGGCKGHELLLGVDSAVYGDDFERILKLFTNAFDKVQTLPIANPYNEWATAANFCFASCARHIEGNNLTHYWLWLEPDSVPMSKGWIDALEAEYKSASKPFMGDFIKAIEGSVDHMSGIGFYPAAMTRFAGEALISHEVPWDLAAAGQIASRAHFTELIHHIWKGLRFDSIEELRGMIGPDPVVYHSDKTGKLIELLRDSRKEGDATCSTIIQTDTLQDVPAHIAEPSLVSSNAAPKSDPESAAINQFTSARYLMENGKYKEVPVPWANREESIAYVDQLAAELKKFMTAPRSTLVVRERLKKARVITKLR